MDRRTSLKLALLAPPVLGTLTLAGCERTNDDVASARGRADDANAAGSTERAFFTDHEDATIRVLADLVLPADARSPAATALGVPAFIDFMVDEREGLQVPMRGGLAWLDAHSRRRTGNAFVEATDAQQRGLLDEIAYPDTAAPDVQHGVAFFNRFRDLVASGFWSTKEGMADIGYVGNVAVTHFAGPPQAELDRLGLTFNEWPTVQPGQGGPAHAHGNAAAGGT